MSKVGGQMVAALRKRLVGESVSETNVSDFFQSLISITKRTSLHINNTKVICVPCRTCSKSTQRTYIILCSHVREKSIKSDLDLPVIEPATSYVGKQEQVEESFEVTSSKIPSRRIEHASSDVKKSNISKTLHSQKNKKQTPSTINNRLSSASIRLENLQIQFGKRRNKSAKSLRGVRVSSLKRIARKHGIVSRPYSNITKNICATDSLCSQTCSNTETFILTESEDSATSRLDTTKLVKVRFGNIVIKFELPTSSKMVDLEEELRKRLKVEMGSSTIKYTDEEGDPILITCDDDLSYCIRSSGEIPIRMMVSPSINLPSICL